jgi:alkylation response protein AidB-like acyl-CoA dehydrogenase
MNDVKPTTATDSGNPEILIERARSLIPVLRQRSAQATADRRLPQETIDDFRRLGLTRCLQPKMFGGFGSDYRVFSKILRTLAQGCGSSAWIAAVHGEHSWVVGNFPERAQHEVWDDNPQAVASASVAPNGTAEIVASGHRLSGRWGFASGCDHAQWFLLGSMTKGGGAPQSRMFLIPRSEVEIVDDWDVMGLCGTGSKSLVVKDVAVPAHRSVSMHELKTGTAPGAAIHSDNPLYRTPRNLVALFSLSSPVVGLAERAVAEFVAITRERRSRGLRVADLEAVQLMVSEASAQAEAAALVTEHTIERNTALVETRQEISAEQVAWSRRNASYATQLAHSAVKLIFEAAGGTALYASNPLQEIFRDITAASAHLSLSWHRSAPYYGQIRLGLPVDFDTL